MTDHDKLCPMHPGWHEGWDGSEKCFCGLIARARADTAEGIAQALEAAEATLTERTDPPGRYRTGLLRGARIAREVGRG